MQMLISHYIFEAFSGDYDCLGCDESKRILGATLLAAMFFLLKLLCFIFSEVNHGSSICYKKIQVHHMVCLL